MAKSNRAATGTRPGQDEIAQRAYELFLQRGSVPGHETDDWLQAEAELSAQSGESEGEQAPAASSDSPPATGASRRREPGGSSGRRTLRQ
jgi:hypothetical protein